MNFRGLFAFTLGTATVLTPVTLFGQQPGDSAPTASPDKVFLHKASMGGYAEVQFGQLAAQKGNSDEVKKFGQKMVDDHTALNEQLKPFADSMGVKAPSKLSPKDQAEYDKLNGLSGDDFDKEYLSFMVKDHHQDLREFRHEEGAASDPNLKAAVTKGTKVIREHTEMVDKLAKDMGVPVPTHRREATTPAGQ
jgi:putative membrane protein